MRKRGAGRGINGGRREDIPYYIIYREGERKTENGKRKSASKREQRKCIYSAEREQIQDDEPKVDVKSSRIKTENGKRKGEKLNCTVSHLSVFRIFSTLQSKNTHI